MIRFSNIVAGVAALGMFTVSNVANAAMPVGVTPPVIRDHQLVMMQNNQMPGWNYFESILSGDARYWFSNKYSPGTLSRVDQVDGNIASGTWSARGVYYYVSGWDNLEYQGWIIFQFRNGYFDCIIYHDNSSSCRKPRQL